MTMDSKVPINFDDLQAEKKFSSLDRLQMSKGAVTCFGVELSQRLEGSGVVVNCVNPEMTKSTLPKEAPLPLRLVFAVFGQSPEKSKDFGIEVACDDKFASHLGPLPAQGRGQGVPWPLPLRGRAHPAVDGERKAGRPSGLIRA